MPKFRALWRDANCAPHSPHTLAETSLGARRNLLASPEVDRDGRDGGVPRDTVMAEPEPSFGWDEIKKHNKKDDCWVVVDNVVYDVTSFLEEHPGGKRLPVKHSGKDVTEVWNSFHGHKKETILKRYAHLRVGVVAPQSKL